MRRVTRLNEGYHTIKGKNLQYLATLTSPTIEDCEINNDSSFQPKPVHKKHCFGNATDVHYCRGKFSCLPDHEKDWDIPFWQSGRQAALKRLSFESLEISLALYSWAGARRRAIFSGLDRLHLPRSLPRLPPPFLPPSLPSRRFLNLLFHCGFCDGGGGKCISARRGGGFVLCSRFGPAG